MKHVKLFEAFLNENNQDEAKGAFSDWMWANKDPQKDYKGFPEFYEDACAIAKDQFNFNDPEFVKTFCTEFWNDETPNDASLKEDGDKERYAKTIKDIDEVRPRMAPAPKPEGMMASQGTKYFDLYLQDEAAAVCIDKYGYEKGIKNWEWMIDQSSGVMFAATAKIANEKYKMLKDLGIFDKYGKNYFERSYFDIWKEWKEFMKSGKLKQAA